MKIIAFLFCILNIFVYFYINKLKLIITNLKTMSVKTHLFLDKKLENPVSNKETTKIEDRVNFSLSRTGNSVDLSTETFECIAYEVSVEVSDFDMSCFDEVHIQYFNTLDKSKSYWVCEF